MTAVRHSRAEAYRRAWAADTGTVDRWTGLSDDPNDAVVIARRARTLAAAWRPPIEDRTAFLEHRVRGRRVLDIGCVAHDADRMDAPEWLHGRLARAAGECVGVDILEAGVAQMRRRGFDAVVHDLSDGLGPLAARGPFDVITAGELIEHVADLDMLFRVAARGADRRRRARRHDTEPYAAAPGPGRAAGNRVENVDHIVYAFPSGIAELAERRGLELVEAATTADRGPEPASGDGSAGPCRVPTGAPSATRRPTGDGRSASTAASLID
ncbi:MAG: methyltransferase domain-containing protein [Acidimicrobiales bacterium]